MKAYRIFLIFLMMALIFSCEDEYKITFVNCNECTEMEPLLASVYIHLRDPYEFGSASGIISIDIFEGNFEDQVLFKSIETSSKETNIILPINKRYTLAATYVINNKNYIVINSITPKVKFTESGCDEPYYYTSPRNISLKLKSTK